MPAQHLPASPSEALCLGPAGPAVGGGLLVVALDESELFSSLYLLISSDVGSSACRGLLG